MFLRKSKVAYFDPYSLQIHLDYLDKASASNIMANGINPISINHFKTKCHEDRHYIDVISTVWGLKYLSQLFDVYNSLAHGKMNIAEDVRNLKLNTLLWKYEHLIQIPSSYFDPDSRWSFKYTIITEDSNKILAIECYDDQNRLICTTPILVDSLLEINAIFEEVLVYYLYSRFLNAETILVEDIWMQKEYINQLISNPQYIEYGICARLLLSYFKLDDLISPFLYGSGISTLALNLTEEQIHEIPVPSILDNISEELPSVKNIRGLAFIKLVGNCLDNKFNKSQLLLDEILKVNSLPNSEVFKSNVLNEMEKFKSMMPKSNVYSIFFHQYVESAKVIIEKRNVNGVGMSLMQLFSEFDYLSPHYILGDDYFDIDPFSLPGSDMLEWTKAEWYTCIDIYKRVLNNDLNWL